MNLSVLQQMYIDTTLNMLKKQAKMFIQKNFVTKSSQIANKGYKMQGDNNS